MADYDPKHKWNRTIYRSWIGRKVCRVCCKVENCVDGLIDRKICGKSLSKYVPSKYRETMGATGSQATHYYCLKKVCANLELTENDKLIDVGCGKGRVLAYFLRKKEKCALYGVELNPDVAEIAKSWSDKYENAHIFQGDAFKLDYNEYTVLFLGRPFEREMFCKFIQTLEGNLTHPVEFVYWVDQQSGDFLNERPGWTMHERKWLFTKGIMPVCPCPQRYSLWTFSPEKMKEEKNKNPDRG